MTAEARSGRVALVLAAVVGLMWMHALVAPASTGTHSMSPTTMSATTLASAAVANHDAGHDAPADGTHHGDLTLAHVCLAVLAMSIGVLIAAGFGGRQGPGLVVAEPAPRSRRVRPSLWSLPPPDIVRELSISRT